MPQHTMYFSYRNGYFDLIAPPDAKDNKLVNLPKTFWLQQITIVNKKYFFNNYHKFYLVETSRRASKNLTIKVPGC